MMLAQPVAITCPYCGETVEIIADFTVGRQEYIEDCQVCCRPISLIIATTPAGFDQIEARREDE